MTPTFCKVYHAHACFFISNLTSCRAKILDMEARAEAETQSQQEVTEFRFLQTADCEFRFPQIADYEFRFLQTEDCEFRFLQTVDCVN